MANPNVGKCATVYLTSKDVCNSYHDHLVATVKSDHSISANGHDTRLVGEYLSADQGAPGRNRWRAATENLVTTLSSGAG